MWIMKYNDQDKFNSGKFVGLDHASGGYPYPTEWIGSAQIWGDLEQATRYKQSFPDIDIYEFKVETRKVEV